MITLRAYQQQIVDDVRARYRAGVTSVLVCAPTGAGKTVLFSYVTRHAVERGNSVMILAHRIELIDQISNALSQFDVSHGFVAAGYPRQPAAAVQVASVQTLARRLHAVAEPQLVIVDEAHHATARNTIGRILRSWPRARILGVTATPTRLSGEGLGDVFHSLVLGPSVNDLVQIGALSPCTVYAPATIDTSSLRISRGDYRTADLERVVNRRTITGDALSHYLRLAPYQRAVAFCVSVEHARHVAAEFAAAGVPALHVDGMMPREHRRDAIQRFRDGRLRLLASCDLISEGFDLPAIECGIFLRPTASVGLWLQQAGRCLRPYPGKTRAVLLDHAGNTLRHGLPNDEREWTLEGSPERQTRASGTPAPAVRVCPQCFSADHAYREVCRQCGYTFPVTPRRVERVDGELREVSSADSVQRRAEQRRASNLDALIHLGQMRGYKNPRAWAEHVLRGRARRARSA